MHPKGNKNIFFHDSLKIISLILIFLIIYSNVDKINQLVLIFIKIGSLLQLILLFLILRKAWHLTINLKYAFRGLNQGTKAIIAIVFVFLLFFAFINQDSVVDSITQTYEETNFSKLNPLQVSSNFTLSVFFKNSQNSIDKFTSVSLKELAQNPQNYIGMKISVKGELVGALDRLKSSDGYIIRLTDNCFEKRIRSYDYNKAYKANGIFLAPEKCEPLNERDIFSCSSFYLEYNYRLNCVSPIN